MGGTVYTDVRLDGYCEGVLGYQKDDDEGCTTMSERNEEVESPDAYVDD